MKLRQTHFLLLLGIFIFTAFTPQRVFALDYWIDASAINSNVLVPRVQMIPMEDIEYIYPGKACGPQKVWDCARNCVNQTTAQSWTGDGYCDDGSWGMELFCKEFKYDGGDCGGVEISGGSDCSSATSLTNYLIMKDTVNFEDSIDSSADEDWFVLEVYTPSIVVLSASGMDAKIDVAYGCNQQPTHYKGWPANGAQSMLYPGQKLYVRVTHASWGIGNYTLGVYMTPNWN
jgi:hypothetical protein